MNLLEPSLPHPPPPPSISPSFPPSPPNHFSDSPSSGENCARSMNIQAPNKLGLKPLIPFHSYRNDLFFPSVLETFGNGRR